MVNPAERAAGRVIEQFRQRRPLRAGSLIVSFFGDVVAPRGGSVWLGGLIRALEPLGVSGRLVRTSIYRLVQDGWFCSSREGRRSYYRLTETGEGRFARATERIYGRPAQDWQGQWLMVLVPPGAGEARDGLRRELGWMGFGALAPGMMGRPVADPTRLEAFLAEQAPAPVSYRATLSPGSDPDRLAELIRNSWKLEETERAYLRFIRSFEPVLQAGDGLASLAGETSLVLRVLLIHEYRRILLRDPQLPPALLPADWHGRLAYALCRDLYLRLLPGSEAHVRASLVGERGPLPPPGEEFFCRFGGIGSLAGVAAPSNVGA